MTWTASVGSVPSVMGFIDTNTSPDVSAFIQVMDISSGGFKAYAYLDSSGYVTVKDLFNHVYKFNMGKELINNKIIEFTFTKNRYFIIRNKIGQARTYYKGAYGDIQENVIKVASGRMLIQDGVNDPHNLKPAYAICTNENGKQIYVPLGAKNQLDIVADASTGTDIFLDNKIVNTRQIVKYGGATYTLRKDGTLYKNGTKIDSNVVSIGIAGQPQKLSMTTGRADTGFKQALGNELVSTPFSFIIQQSFIDNFMTYYDAHIPTCAWAGVTASSGIGYVPTKIPCTLPNQLVGGGIIDIAWIKVDGTFSDNVEVLKADGAGFNAIYSGTQKILVFIDDVVNQEQTRASTAIPHQFIDIDTTNQVNNTFMLC